MTAIPSRRNVGRPPARWDARALPFLEEKLAFRRAVLTDVPLAGEPVLCLYGGAEGRVTAWYRERGAQVVAVDRDGTVDVCADVLRYLRTAPPRRWTVVDLDPYGSSMPAVRALLAAGHRARWICLTEGTLVHVRLRRRINLYRHYGLSPDAAVRPERWHYDGFPAIVVGGLARWAADAGLALGEVTWQVNRYQTALYVGAALIGE